MARVTNITLGNSRTGILSQANDTKGEGDEARCTYLLLPSLHREPGGNKIPTDS